jgi:hypothetical protein
VRGFVRDRCVEGKKHRATGKELHDCFLGWAARNRVPRWTIHQLTCALVANGFGRDPAGAARGYQRIWTGIALK